MKLNSKLTEDQFVQEFLAQELNSKRFGDKIRSVLAKKGLTDSIITQSDFSDKEENTLRSAILSDFRGYKRNKLIFTKYPDDVQWYEATMKKDELFKIRYVNYSYWNKLSSNTHKPSVAAENIKKGMLVYDEPNDQYLEAAQSFRDGTIFPRLILTAKEKNGPYVVLEGHLRLTAMMLAEEGIPDETNVIAGLSDKMALVFKLRAITIL